MEEEVVVEEEADRQVGLKNIVFHKYHPEEKIVEGCGSPEQRPRKIQSGLGAIRV